MAVFMNNDTKLLNYFLILKVFFFKTWIKLWMVYHAKLKSWGENICVVFFGVGLFDFKSICPISITKVARKAPMTQIQIIVSSSFLPFLRVLDFFFTLTLLRTFTLRLRLFLISCQVASCRSNLLTMVKRFWERLAKIALRLLPER